MTIGLINNGVSNSTKTITYPCAYTTKTAVTSASSKKVYPLYNATNMKIDVSVSETLTSGLPYGVTLAGGYKQDIDTQTVSRASYTS